MTSHQRTRRATKLVEGPVRRRIQTKLEVGPVDDPMEIEAERTADRVMAAIQSSVPSTAAPATAARAEEEEELLQGSRTTNRAEEEELLQGSRTTNRSAIGAEGGEVGSDLEARLTAGSGAPLSDGVRSTMESAFGVDFSAVRVSENPAAADIGARAYTTGSDVRFAPGQYAPDTPAGQHLLAHELTHVVQQGAAAARATVRRHAVGDADLKPDDIAALNAMQCFDSVGYVLAKAGRIDKGVAGQSLQRTDGTLVTDANAIPEGAVINFVSRGLGSTSWDDAFGTSRHTMLAAGGGAAWASNNGCLGGPPTFTLTSINDLVVWEEKDGRLRAWPANSPARVAASELEVRWSNP